MRRHFFNEGYFDTLETPEQAYWFGFIAADGHIKYTKKSNGLEIGLATRDEDHLHLFASAIGYPRTLYRTKKSTRIVLYSKKLAEALIRHGLTPRKSHTLTPWSGPDNLLNHYWRGLFDGDGGFCEIHRHKKTTIYHTWKAVLVGTQSIVEAFREYIGRLNEDNCFSTGTVRPHSSIWTVEYNGIRPAQTIARSLYDNLTDHPVLKRKMVLAKRILSTKLHEPIITQMNAETLLPIYERHGNWSKVAQELGVSHNGMYKHIRKLGLTRRIWRHKP